MRSFACLQKSVRFSFCREACTAINRLALGGLEGNLALATALNANSGEHFSCTLLSVLSCGTAVLASGRLILKALRCVELLLACGEHEISATVLALQRLVLEHFLYLSYNSVFICPKIDSNRCL